MTIIRSKKSITSSSILPTLTLTYEEIAFRDVTIDYDTHGLKKAWLRRQFAEKEEKDLHNGEATKSFNSNVNTNRSCFRSQWDAHLLKQIFVRLYHPQLYGDQKELPLAIPWNPPSKSVCIGPKRQNNLL
jgi:hypothetical protein